MTTPTSVIPTWLKNYDNAAYTALVAQEAYAYTQDTTTWPTLFQSLANGLNTYQATNRSADLSGLLTSMYQTYIMGILYATDSSSISNCDGLALFNVGGFLTQVKSRPSSYYNDLVAPAATSGTDGSTSPTASPTSAKMTADLATVNGAIVTEQAILKTRESTMTGATQGILVNFFFSDPPTPTASFSKQDVANHFFIDLHYTQVYKNLTVNPLALPSLS